MKRITFGNCLKKYLQAIALFILILGRTNAQESKAFELRYFSNEPKANGETDFKGETAIFDTEQRVQYLKHYASLATSFWNSPGLDKPGVTSYEINQALKNIKPQPLPVVRRKIPLEKWRYYGYRDGQDQATLRRLEYWNRIDGVSIKNGALHFDKKSEIRIPLKEQGWRFALEFDIDTNIPGTIAFALSDKDSGTNAATIGIDSKGSFYYISSGQTRLLHKAKDKSYRIKLEVDLVEDIARYNLYIDGKLQADFVPLENRESLKVNAIDITSDAGFSIDNLWGTGYALRDGDYVSLPFSIDTFIDEKFEVKSNVESWFNPSFVDEDWSIGKLPISHGSDRHEGEDLYLRKKITIGEFEKAFIEIESMAPSGEIWINGRVVSVIENTHPQFLDIGRYLRKNAENLIAVKVNSFKLRWEDIMHHYPTDLNLGWYAGRMNLHLVNNVYISDVFFYTRDINENQAFVSAKIKINNTSHRFFEGDLTMNLKEWFPIVSDEIAASESLSIRLEPQQEKEFTIHATVEKPKLWTSRTPNLYEVHTLLSNADHGVVTEKFRAIDGDKAKTREIDIPRFADDFMVTSGIRTVSQEGGTFRINREPELLIAPLMFGHRMPLETMATNIRCSPAENLIEELLLVRRMNGNGIRMSVHWSDNSGVDGTNDPRLAEMGDQLGIMFVWTTASFIRVRTPFTMDFEGLGKYVRQVRNHPSIIIWQPGNHPDIPVWNEAMTYYERVYNIIYPLDSTRLISPSADLRHIGPHNDMGTKDWRGNPVDSCHPVWTAPQITRGSMDYPTGYGHEWDYLRKWPFPPKWMSGTFQKDFLDSKERAYFNFEHEESIGQPNWNLQKGKPTYKFHSYEWHYDEVSIGRKLTAEEWQESQAWQGFSAYEAIRKMRWLDYDGFSWCSLIGGPNTGTYQKPLVDAYGYPKIAFYANNMAFQPILGGSKNVDLVYGPDDIIPVIVMNIGDKKTVNLELLIKDLYGKVIFKKIYRNLSLESGRTVLDVDQLKRPDLPEGFYVIEYNVRER